MNEFVPYAIGESDKGTVRALYLQMGVKPLPVQFGRLKVPLRPPDNVLRSRVRELEKEIAELKAQNRYMVETVKNLRMRKVSGE